MKNQKIFEWVQIRTCSVEYLRVSLNGFDCLSSAQGRDILTNKVLSVHLALFQAQENDDLGLDIRSDETQERRLQGHGCRDFDDQFEMQNDEQSPRMPIFVAGLFHDFHTSKNISFRFCLGEGNQKIGE